MIYSWRSSIFKSHWVYAAVLQLQINSGAQRICWSGRKMLLCIRKPKLCFRLYFKNYFLSVERPGRHFLLCLVVYLSRGDLIARPSCCGTNTFCFSYAESCPASTLTTSSSTAKTAQEAKTPNKPPVRNC